MSLDSRMKSLFPESTLLRLHRTGVIAVLVIDDPARAVPLAQSLLAGGVQAMELTLRTPAAITCLRAIRQEVPEMVAGAGTILFEKQVDEVLEAGAAFGVAPGTNPAVIRHAIRSGLPFAPGVVTPSDIDAAVQCGCRELKFFPAEPSGGIPMFSSIRAPFAHLGLQYIPLGGITTGNLKQWISEPDVLAVGGSWLAKRELIDAGNWAAITDAAKSAVAAVQSVRT